MRLSKGWSAGLAVAEAPVEGVDFAELGGEDGAEGFGVDGPAGGVVGVAVAVFLDQAVEELEEVAGGAEVAEGVLEGVVGDGGVDEGAEGWAGRRVVGVGGAGA